MKLFNIQGHPDDPAAGAARADLPEHAARRQAVGQGAGPLQQHTGLPGRVLVGRAGGEDVHREPRGALARQDDTPLLRPLLKVGN